jgi:hypothetical protein
MPVSSVNADEILPPPVAGGGCNLRALCKNLLMKGILRATFNDGLNLISCKSE